MGETVLPTVEETSPQAEEPPICGLNGPDTTHQHRQLEPSEGRSCTPPTLHAPHTLSCEEVAKRLHVDIK